MIDKEQIVLMFGSLFMVVCCIAIALMWADILS